MAEQNKILPSFLMVPSSLIRTKKPLDGYVYGIIYWYSRLKLERCLASNQTIAETLSAKEGSVKNSVSRLIQNGSVKSIYNRQTHQRELIPLIDFGKSTSSTDDLAGHLQMTGTSSTDDSTQVQIGSPNKNIEKENKNNIPPSPQGSGEETPLFSNGELKNPSPADPDAAKRLAVQEIFDHYVKESGTTKNTKLFEDRKDKIKKRLEVYTSEQIKTAITNCFQDSFFSGDNDGKWRADLDYIIRNDRNVEKLLYLKPRGKKIGVFYEQ